METAECKQCKKQVGKQFSHCDARATRRFRSETGALWMGRLCPDCYRRDQQARMARRRASAIPAETE